MKNGKLNKKQTKEFITDLETLLKKYGVGITSVIVDDIEDLTEPESDIFYIEDDWQSSRC